MLHNLLCVKRSVLSAKDVIKHILYVFICKNEYAFGTSFSEKTVCPNNSCETLYEQVSGQNFPFKNAFEKT